jgi:hypothetical protein
MKVTVKYKSNQTYGTGNASRNYIASVKRYGSQVTVSFDFKKPPPGKSNPSVTETAVKSLTLDLSTSEALHLAASILAQAHHPSLMNKAAFWMPPDFMPDLPNDVWNDMVSVELNHWSKDIRVNNKSEAHLGKIELLLEFRVRMKDSDWKVQKRSITKLLDLLPDTQRVVQIETKDLGYFRNSEEIQFTKATVKRLTGMRPTDYKQQT